MLKQFIKSLSKETWDIGFIQNSLDGVIQGVQLQVKWVKNPYEDSWFADPFILDVTDTEIHLLAEEFYEPLQRGRIARLILDRGTYMLKEKNVVLELPTHLSFPAIIRKNGKIYLYPENGESKELNLYQYIPESNECIKVETILSEAVADAVITEIDGEVYLFCTKQSNPNGNILSVYVKDESGRFSANEYTFEENIARMAGDFFEFQGDLYRPAQECNVQYGHAVSLQKVNFDNGRFAFEEVRRLYSVHPSLNVGMHTFNMYKGVIVTDALGFHNMWIRKMLKSIGLLR